MPYLIAPLPNYIRCLVRREYLQDLEEGQGDYVECKAIAAQCVRGDSLHFLIVLCEPLGGVPFTVPIEALVTKECPRMKADVVQPWDVFSSDFGACEITAVRRTPVKLFKEGVLGTYLCTLAFTGSDLADDPGQRKLLHIIAREDGPIAAYPNNRMIFLDRALFGDLTERPSFQTFSHECRAETVERHLALQAGQLALPLNGHAGGHA